MDKEVIAQIKQICELCPSKYCVDCKIQVKSRGKNIFINGASRKIERGQKTLNFA